MSETLTVKSGRRTYDVHFVDDPTSYLKKHNAEKSFFIVDETVLRHYGPLLDPFIPPERFLGVVATEENKSLDACEGFVREVIENNVRKDTVLVAIGGGIIQDITAFIASILYRGIEWDFYPTTLLAQADSCIGSKSSINVGHYKNQVGTFYPPRQVVSSSGFLETLSADDIKSGIGEMLHFFLFEGIEKAQQLGNEYGRLLTERKRLEKYVRMSLEIKKEVVEKDEFDLDLRHLFNYGHTFGHALEAVSGFSVSHGQAVTIGMNMANFISLKKGLLSMSDFEVMHEILKHNMPGYRLADNDLSSYLDALSRDKKNSRDRLGCILVRGPGRLEKHFLPIDSDLRNTISTYFREFH